MLRITCPFCGPRAETEFACAGEATARPGDPEALDAAAWTAHLYARDNVKGVQDELWWHRHGCRRWFRVTRDTRDNSVAS
ncbi:MAG: sarcosine oxidase subunit delta [Alphaproteobacteria bacterium]|nr:sarcosine oxidase subunit delta [Alphaproteobacteria bacterium]